MKKKKLIENNNYSHIAKANIFEKLNVGVSGIPSEENDENFTGNRINGSIQLGVDLENILVGKKVLGLDTQQKLLNNLFQENLSFENILKDELPKELANLAQKFDGFLLDSDRLLSEEDIRDYLRPGFGEYLGYSNVAKKKKDRNAEQLETVRILRLILRSFDHLGYSIGLFLLRNVVVFSNSSADLKNPLKSNKLVNKKVILKVISAEHLGISQDSTTLGLKRDDITSHFGEQLVELFLQMRGLILSSLTEKAHSRSADFVPEDYCPEDPKTGEALEAVEGSLFRDLFNFDLNAITERERGKLGSICVCFLEDANVLVHNKLQEGTTYSKLDVDKGYSKTMFSAEVFFKIRPKNLPMISKPESWKRSSKNGKTGNLLQGGRLSNRALGYPAILDTGKSTLFEITPTDIESVNFLQLHYFEVNNDCLDFVIANFKSVVLRYFESIPNSNFLIRNLDSPEAQIELKTLQSAYQEDLILVGLTSKSDSKPSNMAAKKRVSERRLFISESYRSLSNSFFNLINSVLIADCFRYYQLYFPVFLDAFGGLRYRSPEASFFGIRPGDFLKSLVELKGNHFSRENPLRVLNCGPTHDYALFWTHNKVTDGYSHPSMPQCPTRGTTNSVETNGGGFSLLSGVLGCLHGLTLTNVLTIHPQGKDLAPKRSCVYEFFSNALNVDYPKGILCLYSPEEIISRAENAQLPKTEFCNIVDDALKAIKGEFLELKHSKTFVLRENRSSISLIGLHGEYIYDDIISAASQDEKIDVHHQLHLQYKTIYRDLSFRLSNLVEKSYERNFPRISDFCIVLADHFSGRNAAVNLFLKNESRFVYQESSYEKTPIPRRGLFDGKNYELALHLKTGSVDSEETKLTVVENFISYLESRLTFFVVAKCRKSRIILWEDHGNFNVQIGKEGVVRGFYHEAFVALLLEGNVIEDFLKANNITADSRLKKILLDSKEKRSSILSEIADNKCVKSGFILSSCK